ncbi:hypothetical protein FKM82_011122 [Ascaphus truei]
MGKEHSRCAQHHSMIGNVNDTLLPPLLTLWLVPPIRLRFSVISAVCNRKGARDESRLFTIVIGGFENTV